MITSIFSKSKPINSISVFVLLVLAFVLMLFKYKFSAQTEVSFLGLGLHFFILFSSLFTLNFIVKKNSLTKDNNFATLCFGLFVVLLPEVFLERSILLSNLMVLLSFRRLASLSTQRNTIKKLLDSGIFIAIATLFNAWAIWFIIMPFIALVYHSEKIISYWLIPILGFSSIIILTHTFGVCFPEWYQLNIDVFFYSLKFVSYKSLQFILIITFLLLLLLWSLVYYLPSISEKKRIQWPSYKLALVYLLIALFVIGMQPIKFGGEFLFVVTPFAIICANYFQNNSSKWIKDIVFLIWVLLAVILAFVR